MNFIIEPNELVYFAARATILVVALLVFALAFGSWRRATNRGLARLQQDLAQAQAQAQAVAALTQASLSQLAAQVAGIENKLDARAQLTAAAASGPRGYELALRLARNGTSVEEIAKSSGVTRQEAELIARLHAPRRTA
jgi:hypothetical protein